MMQASLAAIAFPHLARGQESSIVKIAVLSDFSGPYSGIAGQGSLACAQLAAQDFRSASQPPFEIQIVSADHRNNSQRGAALAAHLCDQEGVDLIIDVPNSEVALAVNAVARERAKAYINCGAGTADLTGSACSPFTIHWSFDTNMLARSTGGAFTQNGGSTWFFITADYLFGREMEKATSDCVIAAGGRIMGSAAYPFRGATDFGPLLTQARESGAAVLGLANAGADATACVRAARKLQLFEQMRFAGLLVQLPDVHQLGLENAAGLMLTESFYWDLNDQSRSFTRRLMSRQRPPFYPDMTQAGCYSGVLHFLKAVATLGVKSAKSDLASVVAHMKSTPTDDDAFGRITFRSDGRAMVPALLFRVKSPEETIGPWDYYELVSVTVAEKAFPDQAGGNCIVAKT